MKNSTFLICVLVLLTSKAFAGGFTASVPIFNALCVTDESTGFNWKDGDWVKANFKADKKVLVIKIDMAENNAKPKNERQLRCEAERGFDEGFGSVINSACYLVKEMGHKPLPYDAGMCAESFNEGVLKSIECDHFTFLPDGAFVQYSNSEDVSRFPKDDYKDSIYVSVGKCNKINK